MNELQEKVYNTLKRLEKADAYTIGVELGYKNGHAVSKVLIALRRQHKISSVSREYSGFNLDQGQKSDRIWFPLRKDEK
jgi:hypothetical protein